MSNQSAQPTVSMAELGCVFTEFASEIEREEDRLISAIPEGPPQGIHHFIRQVDEDWQSGDRTMRVHPSINVYEGALNVPIGDDVKALLTALDAKVNAIDDIIDTRDVDWIRKIDLSVVTAFSDVLMLEHLPEDHLSEVVELLREYWVELAQIPMVEQRQLRRIRSANDLADRLDAVEGVYAYRARDINAFSKIPAATSEIDAILAERVISDLYAFRARYLLFEDFRHIERDLDAGHESPIIRLVGTDPDREMLLETVSDIYGRFPYSAESEGHYADLLRELERGPDDVDALVDRTRVLRG